MKPAPPTSAARRAVLLALLAALAAPRNAVRAAAPTIVESAAPGDVALVDATGVADVCFDPRDAAVVRIAAGLLADDVDRVAGRRPAVREAAPTSRVAVIVGTIGASAPIDALIAAGKLDVTDVRGKWEASIVANVEAPAPGVDRALVIAGSDPRGTAYGVVDLCERIGVSPWYWWADVPTRRRASMAVRVDRFVHASPSVKYRGIFINDEDWGLEPWASKTFEPEVGNIGPKTYAKVFELMLRLRANYLWPGMHPTTTPFHQVPGNADTADRYAIVVGSSHAEPMLRNNVGEWTSPKGNFNFITHRGDVLNYWESRVKERTSGESIFTLGMRGIHDSPIVGPKTQAERIATLEQVFVEQRAMLARHLGGGDATCVAQMFCPYKEVLDDYLAGLKVPDDVTIVWPDDNFGYVRRYATEAERKRSGGLGVYYHASYLGAPLAWLWIDTLPPALIWSEMTRAYEQGSRTLWVVNVGDLKNCERSAEFFLRLARDLDPGDVHAPARFLRESAARDFGEANADAIADVLSRLQAINFARKAEHLQWHLPLTAFKPPEMNEAEIATRLRACAELLRDSEAIAARLPAETRDAYFQLVAYPVGITAAANEQTLRQELARADEAHGRPAEANREAAAAGGRRISELTAHYNERIANGKWRNIVTAGGVAPRTWARYVRDPATTRPTPAADNVVPLAPPEPSTLIRPGSSRTGDFVERDGAVSIHAGDFTSAFATAGAAAWRSVPGLGRTGSAVTVLPSNAAIDPAIAPSLTYRFHSTTNGPATLRVRLLPTYPIVAGQGLRFSVAIDDGAPMPMAVTTGFDNKRGTGWDERVMANATEVKLALPPLAPGVHTLRLIAVDAGVVVDKLVIEFKPQPASYDGPAETRLP